MHSTLIGGLQLHRYIHTYFDGMYVKVRLMKHPLQCVCQALLELFWLHVLTISEVPNYFQRASSLVQSVHFL